MATNANLGSIGLTRENGRANIAISACEPFPVSLVCNRNYMTLSQTESPMVAAAPESATLNGVNGQHQPPQRTDANAHAVAQFTSNPDGESPEHGGELLAVRVGCDLVYETVA